MNRKQYIRLKKFVKELQKDKYPNRNSFAEKLREMDELENLGIRCTPKTIGRDIKLLIEDFNAPIKYCKTNHGYYLTYDEWDFDCPPLNETAITALILGAKIAEDVVLEPLKTEIHNAVTILLTHEDSAYSNRSKIDTFESLSGLKVLIDNEVFKKVYESWSNNRSVTILYKKLNDNEPIKRLIDPYSMKQLSRGWYIKGYCHLRKEIRTFALHRITAVESTDNSFERPAEYLTKDTSDSFFEFERINDIELLCSAGIAGYVKERSKAYNQKYTQNDDGSIKLFIESAVRYSLTRWVMAESGEVKVIKPQALADEIKTNAESILKNYR